MKLTAKKLSANRRNGRKGGRPVSPRISKIMRERGCSRQYAWRLIKLGKV